MTLTEFLLARIAEDETVARAATLGPWVAKPAYSEGSEHAYEVESENLDAAYPRSVVSHQTYEGGGSNHADADHIARWDPARVLAECEAKGRIVRDWVDHAGDPNDGHLPPMMGDVWLGRFNGEKAMHWKVLHFLALPYADHPDYREEWRP